MEKRLVFDSSKCTGCRVCEMICSLRHTGGCNPARSRIKIINQKREGTSTLMRCRQCGKPPCVGSCPVDALSRNDATGVITVDFETCIGCNECIGACPLGGIILDPVENQIAICDLCGDDPACAQFCATGATSYVRMDRMAQLSASSQRGGK